MNKQFNLDGHKMLHHLDEVVKWQKGEDIYPIYMAISPSSLCNHKCNFCVYHYKEFKPVYFPMDKYKRLVIEFANSGLKALFFSGDGEPLINKHTPEMMQLAKEKGIDVALNTNGSLLTKDKADVILPVASWIRVSLNAGSAQNYKSIHGTSDKDFQKVIDNLEYMVSLKKEKGLDCTIGVQCTVTKDNFHEIKSIAHLMQKIGVDYFSVKPFLKHPGTEYDSTIENLDEYLKDLGALKELNTDDYQFHLREALFHPSEPRKYNKCLSLPFMVELDASGELYTCGPHIGNPDFSYGNTFEHGYAGVWESDKKKNTMKRIQDIKDLDKHCMSNCRPNALNEFLWKLSTPPTHTNFI
jgi:MoaA/NifB/PqqE/SkfB family radical SAM enzyme